MADERDKSNPDQTAEVIERYGRRGGSARRDSGGHTPVGAEKQQSSGFWQRLAGLVSPGEREGDEEPMARPRTGPSFPAVSSPTGPMQPVVAPPAEPTPTAPPAAPAVEPERVALEVVLPDDRRLVLIGRRRQQGVGVWTLALEGAPANPPELLEALGRVAHGDRAPQKRTSTDEIELPPLRKEPSLELDVEVEGAPAAEEPSTPLELRRRPQTGPMLPQAAETSDLLPPPAQPGAPPVGPRAAGSPAGEGGDAPPKQQTDDARPRRRPRRSKIQRGGAAAQADDPLARWSDDRAARGTDAHAAVTPPPPPPDAGVAAPPGRGSGAGQAAAGRSSASGQRVGAGSSAGPAAPPPPRRASSPAVRAEAPTPLPQAEGMPAPEDLAPPSARSPARRASAAPAKVTPIVGIDFGTSYSSIGVMRAGLELIPNQEGELMVPSVVSFPQPGEVVVGSAARRRMAGEAQWTITSPKRLLGRPYKDRHVQSLLGGLAMRTFAGTDRFTRFEAHGEIYSVTDVCALVLEKLRQQACRFLDCEVEQAVFAVPVGYGSLQRSALEQAARQAGLKSVALLTEPAAALLAHGFRGRRGLVAVYDLGGGTFDFCVVDVSLNAFRVLCAGGDAWLGGDDFDQALAAMVADRFWKETGVDIRSRAVEWQSLLFACEAAKRQLSAKSSAHIKVADLLHTASGTKGVDVRVTRKEFVKLVGELVERTVSLSRQVLSQAKIAPEQVETVVMTGGTSLIPAVRDAVGKLFGRKPLAADPDLAVVRGAASRAAELADPDGGDARTLHEVAGRTIGAGVEGGPVITLFERNTPLPAETRHAFATVLDDQTEMVITLYEAAKSRVDQRQVLGQLRYRGLKPRAAGESKVDFTFLLDADGRLHVTAVVEGKSYEKTIQLD